MFQLARFSKIANLRILRWPLLLALILLAAGCGDKGVSIGVVVPTSGVASNYGLAVERGLQLALEQLNADSAYPHELNLTISDSGSDAETARAQTAKHFDDGALAVIGGITSEEALVMAGEAEKQQRLVLSPTASSPSLSGSSRHFSRVVPAAKVEAAKMATSAIESMELSSFAVIAEEHACAQGFRETFRAEVERLEGEVLGELSIDNPAAAGDLAAEAAALGADAVYLAGYEPSVEALIQGLATAGYQGKVLTTHAFSRPEAIARTGDAAKGLVLAQTVFEADSEDEKVRSFVEAYRAKYGEQPNLFAALGYDSLNFLAESIRELPKIPSKASSNLRHMRDFVGVTGGLQLDDQGDAVKFARLYLVDDNLKPVNYERHQQAKREEIERRRKELKEKLERLHQQAAGS